MYFEPRVEEKRRNNTLTTISHLPFLKEGRLSKQ